MIQIEDARKNLWSKTKEQLCDRYCQCGERALITNHHSSEIPYIYDGCRCREKRLYIELTCPRYSWWGNHLRETWISYRGSRYFNSNDDSRRRAKQLYCQNHGHDWNIYDYLDHLESWA